MKNLSITGTAVLGVKRLAGKFPYESETEGYKGKFYYRYRANGRVFIAHEDDEFNAMYDSKKLAEVHLLEVPSKDDASIMQLTLDYGVLQDQLYDLKTFEAKIEAIKATAISVKVENLNEVEDLS